MFFPCKSKSQELTDSELWSLKTRKDEIIMKTGFKALWNYKGLIVDMGVKPDKEMKPTFFIMTDDMEQIQVTITNSINLAMVRDWLDHLETGVDCHNFNGYADFIQIVKNVFNVYADRQGFFLNYDNTYLNNRKKELGVTDKTIARCAGLGKSTVNDLRRGLTKKPRFHTICRIHSALDEIAGVNGKWN